MDNIPDARTSKIDTVGACERVNSLPVARARMINATAPIHKRRVFTDTAFIRDERYLRRALLIAQARAVSRMMRIPSTVSIITRSALTQTV